MDLIKSLNDLHIGDVTDNADLREYTTYKVGGRAKAIVSPDDTESLITLLKFLKNNKIKHTSHKPVYIRHNRNSAKNKIKIQIWLFAGQLQKNKRKN